MSKIKVIFYSVLSVCLFSSSFFLSVNAEETYSSPFGLDDLIMVSFGDEVFFETYNISGGTVPSSSTKMLCNYSNPTYDNTTGVINALNGLEYKYTGKNVQIQDFSIGNSTMRGFPVLLHDLYDYYLISFSFVSAPVLTYTFEPSSQYIVYADYGNDLQLLELERFNYQDFETGFDFGSSEGNTGWVTTAKLPSNFDYSNIQKVGFRNYSDLNVLSEVPGNARFMFFILPVSKLNSSGSDNLDILITILNYINNNTDATENAVNEQGQNIVNKIDSQYAIANDETFGVGDLQLQITEKMGILSFTSVALYDFFDLFSTEELQQPQLYLPEFYIDVGSESYKIWDSYYYNIYELEEQFPDLISIIRNVLTLCCWLLFFRYLGYLYEKVIDGD